MSIKNISKKACNALVNSITGGLITNCANSIESFEEENENNTLIGIFFMVLIIMFSGIYFMIMLVLWMRVIFYAFKANPAEGLSSIFFYKLYDVYKFGSFINAHTLST